MRAELTLAVGRGAHVRPRPDAGAESIVGPALDFCLVTTQRRHVDDTDLVVTGDSARDWMEKAQLFAGPASDGPRPADPTPK